jgi:tetratricopeptide (TPR) repeat protein
MLAPRGPALTAEHPFPGLRPFAFDDHDFFFGRDEQTYALYRLLDRSWFVAVVGSSGSGKSSLVRAGLLPLLHEENEEAGRRRWLWREMRPGDTPIARLAELLASLSRDTDPIILSAHRDRIAFELRQSSFGVANVLRQVEGLGDASLVLVVDQFEELFRYIGAGTNQKRDPGQEARSRDEATQFVQLLLEASRNPTRNVRVLLTMRSDFIGDCARFHGLPEAVSSTQFLVPSLTRDQLEEVIRCPIDAAAATIDPALVERLLNDSSDEFDQLPVLQHCLLRLWKRAGSESKLREANRAEPNEKSPVTGNAEPPAHRHLTVDDYLDIGEIAGALSKHADEVLARLSVPEVAVEQVFRALAEIDKDGRAIRRALPFSRLFAETGISKPELVQVLERFRAEDCSFLTPPPSAVAELKSDTRIDVGHEALLRRWEKVSGRPEVAAGEEDPGSASVGWLRAEERDGQQYRTLLSILDSESEGRVSLSSHAVRKRSNWWQSRPRTAAWSERYGGGYDRVVEALKDSLHDLKVSTWVTRGVAVGAMLLVVGAGYLVFRINRATEAALHMRQAASLNFQLATDNVNKFLSSVLKELNDGRVKVKGARNLLETAEAIVKDFRSKHGVEHSTETNQLMANLLIVTSDLRSVIGDLKDALENATQAKELATALAQKSPDDPETMKLLYASSSRMGDAIGDRGRENLPQSLQQYQFAEQVAVRMAARALDDGDQQLPLGLIYGKIGDVYLIQTKFAAAVAEYRKGVTLLEKLIDGDPLEKIVDRDPRKLAWRGELASAHFRVGKALIELKQFDEALKELHTSLVIREGLVAVEPDSNVFTSNVGSSYREIGNFWMVRGDLNRALNEYQTGIRTMEGLAGKDQGNSLWLSSLAPAYESVAGILERQHNASGALQYYRKALAARQDLADRDVSNLARQRSLATLANKLGDRLVVQNEIEESVKTYRVALESREMLAKEQPGERQLRRALFISHAKIGDALVLRGDRDGALNEYRLAVEADKGPTVREAALADGEYERVRGLVEELEKADTANPAWENLRKRIESNIRALVAIP